MTWKYLRRYLADNKLSYAEYLETDHWKDVRRRFWASKMHDGSCYACARRDRRLEVHHRSYKRIGHENLHDLCLMCRECHQRAHEMERAGKVRRHNLKNVAKALRRENGVTMRGYLHGLSHGKRKKKRRSA